MPTIAELQAVLERHPKLRASADWASSHHAVRQLLVSSFVALIHYAGTREGRPATVESFLTRLGDGVALAIDDPVYQLRKFLERQQRSVPGARRTSKEYVLALAIKAWNMSKTEGKVKLLALKVDEKFPVLAGV